MPCEEDKDVVESDVGEDVLEDDIIENDVDDDDGDMANPFNVDSELDDVSYEELDEKEYKGNLNVKGMCLCHFSFYIRFLTFFNIWVLV